MSDFLYALNAADAMTVDGSPLLSSFEHDEDDETVTFGWTDGEDSFTTVIDRTGIAGAQQQGNGFLVTDSDGELVKVELFTLEPTYPLPSVLRERWAQVLQMAADEDLICEGSINSLMDDLIDKVTEGRLQIRPGADGFAPRLEALFAASRGRALVHVAYLADALGGATIFRKEAWLTVLDGTKEVTRSLCQTLADHSLCR
ncbi:hypothetical protein [Marinobacter alkaliphilus]|uniref:Uncharacterized protein n=1 Tax=Marinobacter alkaliphilus TaxID=254719 RepID=A0ABZ3E963_9GAMM